jgi:hypothetical protein
VDDSKGLYYQRRIERPKFPQRSMDLSKRQDPTSPLDHVQLGFTWTLRRPAHPRLATKQCETAGTTVQLSGLANPWTALVDQQFDHSLKELLWTRHVGMRVLHICRPSAIYSRHFASRMISLYLLMRRDDSDAPAGPKAEDHG